MKYYYILILSLLTSCNIDTNLSAQSKTNKGPYAVNGKVQSIHEYSISPNTDKSKAADKQSRYKLPEINYRIHYNEQGDVKLTTSKNEDGSLRDSVIYSYNKSNDLIKTSYHSSDGSISSTLYFKYERHNQIENYRENGDGETKSKTHMKYNKNNDPQELETIYANGNKGNKRVYQYNNHGEIESINFYKGSGELDIIKKHSYNSNNLLVKKQEFLSDNSPLGWTEFTYDENGNETSISSFSEDKKCVTKNMSRYNDSNLKIEQTYFSGCSKPQSTYRYEYDESKNLIKTTVYKDEVLTSTIFRDIKYLE